MAIPNGKRVFVVEAGTGGLTAAMILGKKDCDVEVFEKLLLVGGGTHPGSGLPAIYQSGLIAANLFTGAK